MQQQGGVPAQQPVDPGGRFGRRHRPRQAAAGQGQQRRQLQPPLLVQQAGGQPPQPTGARLPAGHQGQRVQPGAARLASVEQSHRLLHLPEGGHHLLGGLLVERQAGPRQPHPDALEQAGEDGQHRLGAGAPDRSVAGQAGQPGQGRRQVRDVRRPRRPLLQARQDRRQGRLELGQRHLVEQLGERLQVLEAGRLPGGLAGGGSLEGVAPAAGVDERHLQVGPPAQLPVLVEGPRLADNLLGGAPGDVEQDQAVEQPAARPIGLLAQIEVQVLALVGAPEPQPARLGGQLAAQRHRGGLRRDLPEVVADLQAIADQGQRGRQPGAQHRLQALVDLAEPRAAQPPQSGQGLGQAHRLDHPRGRGGEILLAQGAGRPHGPAQGGPGRLGPEVVVPARRLHPRAVAAPVRQPRGGPGDPGGDGPGARQPLEAIGVGPGRAQLGQGGRVPGAADNRHPLEAVLEGGADGLAHVGFAARLVRALRFAAGACFRVALAQGAHGLDQPLEQASRVPPALDLVLPPELAVGEARHRGQLRDGIQGLGGLARGGRLGQPVRLGQVHEAHRPLALQPEADGLPLRGELGEGVKHRLAGAIDRVDKQGDRRLHLGRPRQGQHLGRVGRALDQDHVGIERGEGGQQAARAARTVVADAEDRVPHAARGSARGRPCSFDTGPSSRRAP